MRNLTAGQIAALNDTEFLVKEKRKRAARASFWEYRKYINPKLKQGAWQHEIALYLQQFTEDMIAGKKPILIIQAPPQHGKSVQIIDYITWLAGKYPHLRKIFASFSERLGVRANLRIRRICRSVEFLEVFPAFQLPTRQDKNYTLNAQLIEYVGKEGSFRNTTVGGSINGESLDLGIIDDPIKGREAANSETIREKTWDWFADDFFTRFSEEAGLLIIGTRWHLDDPIGRLIDSKPANMLVLKYPAIAIQDDMPEPGNQCKLLYRKEGEALFPQLKSIEFLLARKKIQLPANFEALYQQSPIIVGGGIFKDIWWQYFDILPRIKYSIIVADTAMKTKTQHDYSVFGLFCVGYDNNVYIVDWIRDKWEAPQLRINFKAFWNKHKANKELHLRAAYIEDKSSGTGLIQTIRQYDHIPVVEIQRDTQDKVTRAMAVAPMVMNKYVFLKADASWLADFLSELGAFDSGKHDDQVDVVSDGLDKIFNSVQEFNIRVAG